MMRQPITSAIRLQSAGALLFVACVFAACGWWLSRRIGKGSDFRRRHGRVIFVLMLFGWLAGGAVGVSILNNIDTLPGKADFACAGFGMLAGWVVGMVAGLFMRR